MFSPSLSLKASPCSLSLEFLLGTWISGARMSKAPYSSYLERSEPSTGQEALLADSDGQFFPPWWQETIPEEAWNSALSCLWNCLQRRLGLEVSYQYYSL